MTEFLLLQILVRLPLTAGVYSGSRGIRNLNITPSGLMELRGEDTSPKNFIWFEVKKL